jgi:alanyl-tRNA synthetase
MKSSHEIREAYLKFFENNGHKRVKSGTLVPKDDPTLLFTNAGMNQFKNVFLGTDKREYSRATTSQKCMRVSGKHNDLEMVGRTPRHHTFFEMLGNFSFGDYFKKEAIEFAWELCTEVYKLEKDKLIVTVYEEDDEAWDLWKNHMGIPENLLYRCDAQENFWAMGDTGPCGPCSELHYDLGERIGDTTSNFGDECDRFVEIWNLVFMQFNRDASGKMTPLPRPSIDTGMGLERIACVMQGKASNYETDLFQPIIQEASRLTGMSYGKSLETDTSLQILADHSRACMFLIDDGVVPGNEGRGYVLRKILRRAIRHGRLLGKDTPFIFTLTSLVSDLMKEAYPETINSRDYAATVVKNEEEKFSATLSHGLGILEDMFESLEKKNKKVVPGKELFKLYDTFGFPFDLASEIADEKGFSLDETGFKEELEIQRKRARASWKGTGQTINPLYQELAARDNMETDFTGYDSITEVEGVIQSILKDGKETKQLKAGEAGEVILNRTPFYAESGGQASDKGIMESNLVKAEVTQVTLPVSNLRVHEVKVLQGEINQGDPVSMSVNAESRAATAGNHTSTHLLQAALREVLGPHVKQAGSLVAPERLRFDFTHYKGLSEWETQQIEKIVNEKIHKNIKVLTEIQDLDDAVENGATALFGEKYDQKVRVVSVPGCSKELCGGTHANRTGDIAVFKITNESSISAGVRRIEAITGARAVHKFMEDETILRNIALKLNSRPAELENSVTELVENFRNAQKEVEKLQVQLAQQATSNAASEIREIEGIKVIAREVKNADRNTLRQVADDIRNRIKSGIVVLGSISGEKVSLLVMVTEDLTGRIKANELIRPVAKFVQGGGGGKPDMAEAGGKNPAGLKDALDSVYEQVEKMLG